MTSVAEAYVEEGAPRTLLLGELDPRLINRTGLLSLRLKAGKQSVKRVMTFYAAKAAAERAYAKQMLEWASKEEQAGASGVGVDASVAAALLHALEHAKKDAQRRLSLADFYHRDIASTHSALLE